MPRKKKENITEVTSEPIVEYVINWDKIAADVKEAARMVEAKYEKDDGPLSDDQIEQIKATAPKAKRTRKTKA